MLSWLQRLLHLQLLMLQPQLSLLLARPHHVTTAAPPPVYPPLQPGRRCEDSEPECPSRAEAGECEESNDLLTECRLSCRHSSLCPGGDCCHQAPLVLFCSDCENETANTAVDDMGGPSPHGSVFVVEEQQPRDRTWVAPLGGGALRHLRFDRWDSYDQTTVVVDRAEGSPVRGAVPME
jgi:hypothetical protein